jgi:TolA-binding protein
MRKANIFLAIVFLFVASSNGSFAQNKVTDKNKQQSENASQEPYARKVVDLSEYEDPSLPADDGGKTVDRNPAATKVSGGDVDGQLRKALRLMKEKNHTAASQLLFQMSINPRFFAKRTQIKYWLAQSYYALKMYQLAAFQYISVIRDGTSNYLVDSLEKLSLAADALGDDTLLNYAISRVRSDSFPAEHRDMLFFRIGEFQIREGQYKEAIKSLSVVAADSPNYDKASYLRGLAWAYLNDPKRAIAVFDDLLNIKQGADPTDTVKVAAQIGKARALYQSKDWEAAILAYRDVPRDSEMWHDTLFEASWAMMRTGQFRSAMSNFQSLHSPYYEDNFLPESLLLRSIVYLYICQYSEMEKTLNLFRKIYDPVQEQTSAYLKNTQGSIQYFNDVVKVLQASTDRNFDFTKRSYPIPYIIVQKVVKEGDFQRSFKYIKKLIVERRKIRQMPLAWKQSAIGKFSLQTVDRRLQRARSKAGRQIRAHMLTARGELIDFFEQEGFLRYEYNNSKRESLKQKVAGQDLPRTQIDTDTDRDYYVQNGYQYWPFKGEYWLDELGNYHYVGTQSCQ